MEHKWLKTVCVIFPILLDPYQKTTIIIS